MGDILIETVDILGRKGDIVLETVDTSFRRKNFMPYTKGYALKTR
jgi:hypothetical protein